MCWKCLNHIDDSISVFRSSVCPVCGVDLHSCRNCRFYSPGSHYDCHETVDELVVDKERSNFCEWFSIAKTFSGSVKDNLSKSDAKAAFDKLFNI